MKSLLSVLFFFSASSSFLYGQTGQFKIRNDAFIQIGYDSYKVLTFGQSVGTPNNGSFAIESWSGGLNIWKPWPNPTAANYLLFIRDNGNIGMGNSGNTTEKLWISGNLRVNSTVYTSDERFKKNLLPIANGTNDLLRLTPYQYTFKQNTSEKTPNDSLSVNVLKEPVNNYNFDDKLHFGFSAQEVQKVYPHLVSEDANGYLAVNYVEFIPVLIKAIQEQNEKIAQLEKRVEVLSNKKQ